MLEFLVKTQRYLSTSGYTACLLLTVNYPLRDRTKRSLHI